MPSVILGIVSKCVASIVHEALSNILLSIWAHRAPRLRFLRCSKPSLPVPLASNSEFRGLRHLWLLFDVKIRQSIHTATRMLTLHPDIQSKSAKCGESALLVSLRVFDDGCCKSYSPTSVNVNSALYILQTMTPTSSFQCSISHIFASVTLMYQVSKLQLTAHSTARQALIVMLSRAFNPVKQCRSIVIVSAATEASDDAASCNIG